MNRVVLCAVCIGLLYCSPEVLAQSGSNTSGTYYFPQLAFGGGFQSTLTYVNYSPQPVSCQTTFYADSGQPLQVPFAGGQVSARTDNLAPGADIHDQSTAPAGGVQTEGWAKAQCTGPVKASLLYRLSSGNATQGEAGVNATTTPATEFVTFAQTQTGVAYANPSSAPAVVTIAALDSSGAILGKTSVTLQPNAHGAANIGPLLGLTSFTGSIQITSSVPIVSLSLNAEAFPVFSSLPPGDLPAGTPLATGASGGTPSNTTSSYYFPQLAFGGGFQSTLTYVNYSPQPVSCQTTFYSDSGQPLQVPFAGGSVSTRTDNLAAGADIHVQTTAAASIALAEGWAKVQCNGPIKASLLYRLSSGNVAQGEAGVNAATTPATEFVTFAQTQTGIAYANPSGTPANMTVTALDPTGASLGQTSLTLPPNAHGASNIGPLLGLTSFTGSVQITSSVPILSLSLNAEAFPVFSSLPPGDLTTGTPLVTAVALPQIQSLILTPNPAGSGASATGSITLSGVAPSGGAVVALSSSSGTASVPATVTVPAGATSVTFAVSVGTAAGGESITITALYAGRSTQTVLTVTPPVNPLCANIGGNWQGAESGTVTQSVVATAESGSTTNPVSGSGNVTITQTGCSIQYNPISETGLIGSNLTPSQLASLARTGTVNGNNVSVTGLLALVDTVASAQAGFTVTDISSNSLTGSGSVAGAPPVIKLNETGTFVASGTYSVSGQSGSFTETITTSSTATFSRGGVITNVAGDESGTVGSVGSFSGDGGPAQKAGLSGPTGVAADAFGNFFIADTLNNRIRKVSADGTIITFAGVGPACGNSSCFGGFSGDGGPATSAALNFPHDVAVDASGNLFIADSSNNRIRRVSPDGIITTVAGSGVYGFSGDGGPATSASLAGPQGVAVDASGNLFIADTNSNRIRKVSANGIITTVAGKGPTCSFINCGSFSGDRGPATSAALYWPFRVAVDRYGDLFIADTYNNRVREVLGYANGPTIPAGTIATIAGNGTMGFSGDGGPATFAQLSSPYGVAVDYAGNVFISDTANRRIRVVSGGNINTVAGPAAYFGPALENFLTGNAGIALDPSGNLYIADAGSQLIREVSLVGTPVPTAPASTAVELTGVRFAALGSAAPLKVVLSLQ